MFDLLIYVFCRCLTIVMLCNDNNHIRAAKLDIKISITGEGARLVYVNIVQDVLTTVV